MKFATLTCLIVFGVHACLMWYLAHYSASILLFMMLLFVNALRRINCLKLNGAPIGR
jgi:hypothetical protein